MAKTKTGTKKTTGTRACAMPAAPWIYIHDSSPGSYVTTDLLKLIPNPCTFTIPPGQDQLDFIRGPSKPNSRAVVIRDNRSDGPSHDKTITIQSLKAKAIKAGANFVSINIAQDLAQLFDADFQCKFNTTNHCNMDAAPDTGAAIYKWLFTVLTIRETLHLISDADMKDIDTNLFPEYEYCSISQSRAQPHDAKIQFVALILTKPQITAEKKLVWTVADKTGVANFYFQHRGKTSEYTWDWVMSLKPGERRALPRMPMVEIKERTGVRVVKAPFRAVAAVVGGAGFVVKQVGKGISKASKTIKMGSSSQWIPEADIDTKGDKIDWTQRDDDCEGTNETEKTLDEKSEKIWDDGASIASTEAEGDAPAKKSKDFL